MRILLGFYSGIGDFVSALPCIREVSENSTNNLFVAVSEQNRDLIEMLNLKNVTFIYFSLFSFKNLQDSIFFLFTLIGCKLDIILFSPHPQDNFTSWKLPILGRILKFIRPSLELIGTSGDKNSYFYTKKILINKQNLLITREILFFKAVELISCNFDVDTTSIFDIENKEIKNELVINPGASKKLRLWNINNYISLCEEILNLDDKIIIRFIGLEHELIDIKNKIHNVRVLFETGNLNRMIMVVNEAKCIITMDSGFSHIAGILNKPHIAIFGSANPNLTRPLSENSHILYKQQLDCQPCNAHVCKLVNNECMDLITSKDVIIEMKRLKII